MDTHVHADHITGLGALRDANECATAMGEESRAECVSVKFREGVTLRAGAVAFRILYTPGHTEDSQSLLLPDRVFTGDTLLIRGTGRTNFQNGGPWRSSAVSSASCSTSRMRRSCIPPATITRTVSTIGEKKRYNPRLQVSSAAEYAAIMDGLELSDPKLMDVAAPANLACGRRAGTRSEDVSAAQ